MKLEKSIVKKNMKKKYKHIWSNFSNSWPWKDSETKINKMMRDEIKKKVKFKTKQIAIKKIRTKSDIK
jgi:hypothetical protein